MRWKAASAREPWYGAGLRFSCTRCGACCRGVGYVWVEQDEIAELARHLDLDPEPFGRRYLRRVGRRLALVDGPDGACVFWRDGCTVYGARPRQCRSFPFWPDNLRSEGAWARVAEESPGVNQGRLYSREEIDEIVAGVGDASQRREDDEP